MGSTTNFGFEKFGPSGQISANGYKFSLKDRDVLDALLYSLFNHDHQAGSPPIQDPAPGSYLGLAASTTGGNIPAGRSLFYKFSFVDGAGNETAASPAVPIITPAPIVAPTAPILSTETTGGTLEPGTYRYALSYYQNGVGETQATQVATIVVPQGTSTNKVVIDLPLYRTDVEGWVLYRRGPNDSDLYWVATIAAGSTPPTQYEDTGLTANTSRRRPSTNTTNSKNRVTVTLPAAELPLQSGVAAWRLYRSSDDGVFPAQSLVATVSTTSTEGGADLVTTYDDIGLPLGDGIPLQQSAIPPAVAQLNPTRVFEPGYRLPAVNAPQGVHQFYAFLPGTLTAKTYSQFYVPNDMPIERVEAFFLTAPTGVDGSNYVKVRVKDDSLVDEVQSLYNDAISRNEIQGVYTTATAGTFTLTFGAQTTAGIAFDATAATVKSALEALSTITTVNVTGNGLVSDPWLVEFVDPGLQNVAIMTASSAGLTGGSAYVYESVAGSDGGTFTLSDGTDTTSAIAYNASAATIKTRLETDITSITTVTVTGSGTEADPWVITFTNPGDQNLPLLLVNDASLNGTSTIAEVTKGRGNTVVEVIVDDTAQYHFWQSSTTDELSEEAEGATGGVAVSDSAAGNDSAAELDTQNETNTWSVGTLDAGDYVARFYVADIDESATFVVRVLDDLATPALVAETTVSTNRVTYTPAFEIEFSSTGAEQFMLQVEKTDAGAGRVRVDRYEVNALLPTLHSGQTGVIEVEVVGSPSTNGADVQVNVWY